EKAMTKLCRRASLKNQTASGEEIANTSAKIKLEALDNQNNALSCGLLRRARWIVTWFKPSSCTRAIKETHVVTIATSPKSLGVSNLVRMTLERTVSPVRYACPAPDTIALRAA